MAIMQLNVIPLGTGSTSVGDFVVDIQNLLKKSGAAFQLTDMGTIIEGEPAELLELAAEINEDVFRHGAQRVVTQIVIDDRRDKKVSIGEKTASVQEKLSKS